MKRSLYEIGLSTGTDKATQHKYCDFYEKHLTGLFDKSISLLEIGVWKGESLRIWKEYFQTGNIYAIDIDPTVLISEDRISTILCDQTNRQSLLTIFDKIEFDIIVDDGGHKMDQQQISIGSLFTRLKPGGFYLLEDLHTSLWEGYRNFEPYETSTLYGLEKFQTTRIFEFPYLTPAENANLTGMVEFVEIFKNTEDSITSVIRKRW